MSRRTYLLLAAVANCWSTVQLSGIIYTLSKGLYPDFTYDVCCFYNGSAQKPWDIQLSLENQRLQAALIDESTIGYRGNSSAVFHDWDPTQSAVVSIWSQNSMGTELTVPLKEPHTYLGCTTEKNMLETFLIYCCSAAENSNQLCDDLDQINFQSVTKWTYHYKFQKSKGHIMGVAAKYSDDSGGGIKWYVEPSIPQGLLVFGLLALIFFSFRKWKRRKTKEIKISLPPIFDPIVMERLRLRNVEFPQSRNPPDEGISSTRVPSRIFLDSMETEKIVALSTQLNKSNDPPDPDSSPYTEMDIIKKPDSFTYAQQK